MRMAKTGRQTHSIVFPGLLRRSSPHGDRSWLQQLRNHNADEEGDTCICAVDGEVRYPDSILAGQDPSERNRKRLRKTSKKQTERKRRSTGRETMIQPSHRNQTAGRFEEGWGTSESIEMRKGREF